VLYLMGKTVPLAEYLRIALGALSRNARAEEPKKPNIPD
jgi:hypothetical protein